MTVDGKKADAHYEGKSLRSVDVVIPRIGRSLTQFGIILLNHLELNGVPSTLSMRGLQVARNKYLALQALFRAGIKIPTSMLIASRISADQGAGYVPPPVVLKLLSGTQGVGVMKARSIKEAGPIIDTLTELDQLICVQKYLPNPGEDVRVFVVGDQPIAAMKRMAAPHEWRSNIHTGGRGVAYKISPSEREVAVSAVKAVGV